MILHEKTFDVELSGDEVYYTSVSILLVKIMLCIKRDYQKDED